jgi:hypothetical protein
MVGIWNNLFKSADIVQKHSRVSPGAKTFDRMAVMYSFYQENGNLDKITRAMHRLFDNGLDHKHLAMRHSKITLLDVFLNPANRKIWHFMVHEDDATWGDFIGRDGTEKAKAQFQPLVQEAQKHFNHFFYQDQPAKAQAYFSRGNVKKEFEAWVVRLSRSLKKYNREIGGRDLVFNRPTEESIIFRFFRWYDLNRPIGGLTLGHLTDNITWGHFVEYMQINEIHNFWKREEQILREREAE